MMRQSKTYPDHAGTAFDPFLTSVKIESNALSMESSFAVDRVSTGWG